jgi:hypothetical protein
MLKSIIIILLLINQFKALPAPTQFNAWNNPAKKKGQPVIKVNPGN